MASTPSPPCIEETTSVQPQLYYCTPATIVQLMCELCFDALTNAYDRMLSSPHSPAPESEQNNFFIQYLMLLFKYSRATWQHCGFGSCSLDTRKCLTSIVERQKIVLIPLWEAGRGGGTWAEGRRGWWCGDFVRESALLFTVIQSQQKPQFTGTGLWLNWTKPIHRTCTQWKDRGKRWCIVLYIFEWGVTCWET